MPANRHSPATGGLRRAGQRIDRDSFIVPSAGHLVADVFLGVQPLRAIVAPLAPAGEVTVL
jgi:hypothetical protein